MTTDPREVLAALLKERWEGWHYVRGSGSEAGTPWRSMADAIRAWALEPEQVEQAARIFHGRAGVPWGRLAQYERDDSIGLMCAAIQSLFGGDDDK